MTAIPQPASPASSFAATYDAWNRMISLAGVAAYSYDGLNRRTTKLVSGVLRDLYYSDMWQVLEERVGGATNADRQFVWGLRYIDDLVVRDRSTERLYALQDANWNVTAVVDTSGAVQERYRYTAYGLPTFMNSGFVPQYASAYAWETLYCGYRWDSETWLYLARNRYLNSAIGVWITRDPVGFDGGDTNFGRYIFNRVVNATDPAGEIVPALCFIGGLVLLLGLGGGCSSSPPQIPAPCGNFTITNGQRRQRPDGTVTNTYYADFNPGGCQCNGRIKLSQAIEVDGFATGRAPHFDYLNKNNILPGEQWPEYVRCGGANSPKGGIQDAPGNENNPNSSITICAICETTLPVYSEMLLSCINFTYNLKSGAIGITSVGQPTSPWTKSVKDW